MDIGTKLCTVCGEVKLKNEFVTYQRVCKMCKSIINREKYRGKFRESDRPTINIKT